MTDSDLRELDEWIAEHVFNGVREPICRLEGHWLDEYEGSDWCYTCACNVSEAERVAPYYSSQASWFALVKREIERRGWEWACAYERPTEHLKSAYTFTVYVIREPETNAPTCYDKLAASEELAGCLAVKAAVESISSSIPA